jgi:2-amino-4-hydroxy-6-hydroxymethyldihydropteridine diphosphokinase
VRPEGLVTYLGLGSNLGHRQSILDAAIADLTSHPELTLLQRASLYSTTAQGEDAGVAFLNTAVKVVWHGTPEALLDLCQSVETLHGRERSYPNAPRTLDIDLLWLESGPVRTSRLSVPHPRLHQRAFALVPLLELNQDLVDPKTHRLLSSFLTSEVLLQGIVTEGSAFETAETAGA